MLKIKIYYFNIFLNYKHFKRQNFKITIITLTPSNSTRYRISKLAILSLFPIKIKLKISTEKGAEKSKQKN
jgi:hypothetical protein